MSYASQQTALKAYQQVGIEAALSGASPHLLISMLLQGALDRIASAKGLMQRGDSGKGLLISKAISILDGLRQSLDFDAGAAVADNLDKLYDYCQRRLLEANVSNDTIVLDEVTGLLRQIKGAWDAIAGEVRGPLPKGAQLK